MKRRIFRIELTELGPQPESDWATMCLIEPRLKTLEQDIRDFREELRCKASDAWYSDFKPRMVRLVGFGARRPELKTCQQYDTVYRHLLFHSLLGNE